MVSCNVVLMYCIMLNIVYKVIFIDKNFIIYFVLCDL